MNIPKEGEVFQVHSYKHNGQIHRVWQETTVLSASNVEVIGGNDRTLVTEADGRVWMTREPAICYFHDQHWFNIIGMLRDDGIYYYCNLSSPFAFDEKAIKYIDYDLDVKVFPDMSYILLDEDEYSHHRKMMKYPQIIDNILKKNVEKLINWIENYKGPFADGFVEHWYMKYQNLKSSNMNKSKKS